MVEMIIAAVAVAIVLIIVVAWLNHEPNLSQASRIGVCIAAGRYEECAKFCQECDRKHLAKELVFMMKRAKKADKKYKYVFISFLYRTIFGDKPKCLDNKYFDDAWKTIKSDDMVDIQRLAKAIENLSNES